MRNPSTNGSNLDGSNRIRVLVAEDEPDVRQYLAVLMKATQTLELVGQAADTDEAIRLAEELLPDVALVDVKMPGGGGPRAAREIRDRAPATQVMAFSALSDPRTVLEMLGAGAAGYLIKNAYPRELVAAIERAAQGLSTLSDSIAVDVRPRDTEQLSRRRGLVQKRLEEEERTVVFQPIVELATGQVAGLEALTRFAMGAGRSTKEWFEEAGAVGMRVDLELAAARAALEYLPLLPPEGFMALNFSPDTLLSPLLADALAPLPAHRLVIEVSAEALPVDLMAVLDSVEGLRTSGVRLAVDDVGAGDAGTRGLLLRPDFLKLDVSLTREIDARLSQQALRRRLVGLAADLGVTVIAEGIETAEELEVVRALGVTLGQGYYLGRPAPLGAAVE